jgi:hypothetical protein
MMKRKPHRSALLAAIVLTAGCATTGGRVGSTPPLHRPAEAGTLTLSRDGSLVGLFATMRVKLDQNDIYRLGRSQSVTLNLDPGDYLLEYSIGFNNCGRVVHLRPRQSFHLKLLPNCMMHEE